MNRYFFSLIATAIVAAPGAHAQTTAKPMSMDSGMAMHQLHANAGEHAKMMAKLNLNDAQKTQIKTIHAKYEAQMKEAHGGGMEGMSGMSGMNNLPGVNKMMTREMAEVRTVLTPDQQKQFDTMMVELKKHHEAMDHSKMKMLMGSMPDTSH